MVVKPKAVEEISFNEILQAKKTRLAELLPNAYKELNDSDPAVALLEISVIPKGY